MANPKTETPAAMPEHIKPAVLVKWREDMGYTQSQAAERLGCSATSILNWENGHTDCPRYIGLAMAALAMDMQPYGSK